MSGAWSRKTLREVHHRFVARGVAVRVVLAEDVADRPGRLLVPGCAVSCAGPEPQLAHGVEDPALHRLEAVRDVRNRPVRDEVHRVVEEDSVREHAGVHALVAVRPVGGPAGQRDVGWRSRIGVEFKQVLLHRPASSLVVAARFVGGTGVARTGLPGRLRSRASFAGPWSGSSQGACRGARRFPVRRVRGG